FSRTHFQRCGCISGNRLQPPRPDDFSRASKTRQIAGFRPEAQGYARFCSHKLFSFRAARRRRRGRAWNLLFWVAQRFSAAVEHLRRPASAPEVPSNRRQLLLLSLRMVYPRSLTMTTSRRLRHLGRALLPVLLLTSLSQSAEHRADPPALQPILHHISSA